MFDMAIVKLTTLMPRSEWSTGSLYDAAPVLTDTRRTAAVFVSMDGDSNEILLRGTGFKYRDGELVAGTITSIVFQNSDGDNYMRISKVELNAKRLPELTDQFDEKLYDLATRGNDTLIGTSEDQWLTGGRGADRLRGRGEQDILAGGQGNDTYTGNGGSDYFFTGIGQGRDVVTDFDPNPEGNDQSSQDYFTDRGGEYEIRKRGNDTIIDYGHGDMLILLNVKRSDVDNTDFNI
jgi:Ca2+-binding RTX toxin-like protein